MEKIDLNANPNARIDSFSIPNNQPPQGVQTEQPQATNQSTNTLATPPVQNFVPKNLDLTIPATPQAPNTTPTVAPKPIKSDNTTDINTPKQLDLTTQKQQIQQNQQNLDGQKIDNQNKVLDYTANNQKRLDDIKNNLTTYAQTNPQSFRDRATFDANYNYNGRSDDQKKILDQAFGDFQNKSSSDLLTKMVSGQEVTDAEKQGVNYTNAMNQKAKVDMYSSMGIDGLATSISTNALLPGSPDYENLKKYNPDLLNKAQSRATQIQKLDLTNIVLNGILANDSYNVSKTLGTNVQDTQQKVLDYLGKRLYTYEINKKDLGAEYTRDVLNNPEVMSATQDVKKRGDAMVNYKQQLASLTSTMSTHAFTGDAPAGFRAAMATQFSAPIISQMQVAQTQLQIAGQNYDRVYQLHNGKYEASKAQAEMDFKDRSQLSDQIYKQQDSIASNQYKDKDAVRSQGYTRENMATKDIYDKQNNRIDNENKVYIAKMNNTNDIYKAQMNISADNQRANQKLMTDLAGKVASGEYTQQQAQEVYNTQAISSGQSLVSSENLQSVVKACQTRKNSDKVQCGALANDYIKSATGKGGGVGDSFDSKVQALNKLGISDQPVVGGLFTFQPKGSATGHIGIVTGVNSDGSINVVEANREGSKTGGIPKDDVYKNTKGFVFSQAPSQGNNKSGGMFGGINTNGIDYSEFAPEFKNEDQSKSLSFGKQMIDSEKILNNIEINEIGKLNNYKGTQRNARNWLQNETQQSYNQAKSNFITAVLRKDSGAAISESEFQKAEKEFFAQYGDNDSVIKQKQATRNQKIDSMIGSSGKKNVGYMKYIKNKTIGTNDQPTTQTWSTAQTGSTASITDNNIASGRRKG